MINNSLDYRVQIKTEVKNFKNNHIMLSQYILGVLLALCLAEVCRSAILPPLDAAQMNALNAMMNPPSKDMGGTILTSKDTTGHFPASTNTIYPGMLPPGYSYTRRIRTRNQPMAYPSGGYEYHTSYPTYPAGYSYHRRVRVSNPVVQYPTSPVGSYYRHVRYSNGWPTGDYIHTL